MQLLCTLNASSPMRCKCVRARQEKLYRSALRLQEILRFVSGLGTLVNMDCKRFAVFRRLSQTSSTESSNTTWTMADFKTCFICRSSLTICTLVFLRLSKLLKPKSQSSQASSSSSSYSAQIRPIGHVPQDIVLSWHYPCGHDNLSIGIIKRLHLQL